MIEEIQRSTEESRKLQGQLQVVCAWTKRINIEGKWIALDEFLTDKLNAKVTYGVSPEAMEEVLNLEQKNPAIAVCNSSVELVSKQVGPAKLLSTSS